jgi:hypothetical protein
VIEKLGPGMLLFDSSNFHVPSQIVDPAENANVPARITAARTKTKYPSLITCLEASHRSVYKLSEEELRSEMLKGGVNLSGSERVRLELDEAAASYDEHKAANVFAHLAKNGTWQVPTFTAVLRDSEIFDVPVTTDPRLKYIPPAVQKRWSEAAAAGAAIKGKSYDRKVQVVGAMHRAGVPLLAGTDAGWVQPYVYAGFSLHDELRFLVRAGLTPLESLQTATINPAHYLGFEKDLGTIAKGKLADLVLLQADPLLDINNTQKIEAVIVNGRLLHRSELDSLLAQVENDVKNK